MSSHVLVTSFTSSTCISHASHFSYLWLVADVSFEFGVIVFEPLATLITVLIFQRNLCRCIFSSALADSTFPLGTARIGSAWTSFL